jgi:hypothetical protein
MIKKEWLEVLEDVSRKCIVNIKETVVFTFVSDQCRANIQIYSDIRIFVYKYWIFKYEYFKFDFSNIFVFIFG